MKWRVFLTVLVVLCLGATAGLAAYTERLSVGLDLAQPNGASSSPTMDGYGDIVAFASLADNLVEGDNNECSDIFASKRGAPGVIRLSVDSFGTEANGPSTNPCINAEAGSVAYESLATNLLGPTVARTSDTVLAVMQVYVTDAGEFGVITGTSLISASGSGNPGNGASREPSISAYGQYVAFTSDATDLIDGDANGFSDVFVRDRGSSPMILVSRNSAGDQANGPSYKPMISADGWFVVFISEATNLVEGTTDGLAHVYIRDLDMGTTERVDVSTEGVGANGAAVGRPAVSGDGGFVAFASLATNLVAGDTNGVSDVFLRDRRKSKIIGDLTTRVSLSSSGEQANGQSVWPSISLDGRFVGFASDASNLAPDDTNGVSDVFVRDAFMHRTMRFSIPGDGTQVPPFRTLYVDIGGAGDAEANGPSGEPSVAMAFNPGIDVYCCTDGRWNVAFTSQASNLVPDDTNEASDVFLRSDLFMRNENDQTDTDLAMVCFNVGGPRLMLPLGEIEYGRGTYTVNGNPVRLGLGPGDASYLFLAGEDAQIGFVPDPGWEFTSWTGDAEGQIVNPMTLRDFFCLGISARTKPIPYTLTIDKVGDGTITVDDVEVGLPFTAIYYYDDAVTIMAAAGVGRVFSGWSGDASGNGNPLLITFDKSMDIVAHFPLPTVTLSVGAVGDGTVTVDGASHPLPWTGTYSAGATVVLEALPETGILFAGWSGSLDGNDNPVEFTLLESSSATATFASSLVTLEVTGDLDAGVKVNGVTHGLPWSSQFAYGAQVSLQAVPEHCDRFVGWSGDLTGMDNPATIVLDSDMSIEADFGDLSVFPDVGCSHWAAREIAACFDAGIVEGTSDGEYLPDAGVDRATMAVYIARALAGGDDAVRSGPSTAQFVDVPVGYWAYNHVAYCYEHHIVVGYTSTTYVPEKPVDRGQMAVFVARSIVNPLGDEGLASYTPPTTPTFNDVTSSNDWAWCYRHVEYAREQGIVHGYDSTTYGPERIVTRDQMAVFVARAFQLPL